MNFFTSMKRLFTACMLLVSLAAQAQDKIYVRTQRQPIEGTITEVTDREVKYHMTDRPLPVLAVDKVDVIRLEFQSGQKLQINDPSKDFNFYYDQHLWNAKVNLFSPLNGHTQLFLENAVKPGRSREFEINIIGLGLDPDILEESWYNPATGKNYTYEARGLGLGYGMRFIRMPDYLGGGARLRHLMQGSYVKPSVSAAYYTRNFITNDHFGQNMGGVAVERKPVFALTGNITFGKQWILDNMISIDAYFLTGIGYDNVRTTQEKITSDYNPSSINIYESYNSPYNAFGNTRFGKRDLGLTLGSGIRVGFLFDWKKETKTTIVK